ncbi:serine/threonine-protein phosphatase 1 regulatory subunit 10-like [Ylistrum balloti]|uniref:serine/threonine-protein phosphatase 1 regulatory subunit 10-like n=1 Tax=Ylistrum balloti TaxID=509963 RepID=UPI002905CB7B|nr:serine/threonine-protein phosphatase 1 regulatory subunit 10-like [Ylistrum balloti]
MPPIDPHQLLKALSSLLTQSGAIKGPTESTRICSLMRDVTKLASKCVYINILRATETQDVLEKFIDVGGWDILNVWLEDSKNTENTPILVELLKVYQQLPITVELLKKNGAAKTIKQFRKSEDEMLKSLSSEIVEKWMNKIRENSNNKEAGEANEKDKKKKKKSEKSDKSEKSEKSDKSDRKEKDSEKDKQKEKDKHKHVSSSHHHHHHHHHRVKEEKAESSPQEKSDSVSVDNLSTNTATGTVTPGNGLKIHIKLKRNDQTVKPPEQKRPSTVKRPPVKPRSSGVIEDSGPVAPPKKKVSTLSDNKPVIKRPGSDQKIKEEPPWKKSRLHLTTSSLPSNSPTEKSPTLVSPGDIHNQIKFPFQKSIKSEMHEDNSFINDIIRPVGRIKRKPRPGVNGTTPTKTTTSSTPTTPPSPVSPTTALKSSLPSVPSFYKETLETSETNGTSPTETRSPSPTEKMDTTEAKEINDNNMETDNREANVEKEADNNTEKPAVDNFGESLQSSETTTRKKKKKRLTVSWAEESKLHQYHYFEMDETERENVNKPKENFDELKKHEMMMDRRVAETAKRFTNDNMQEAIPWRIPFLISGLPPPPSERGSQSLEKDIQKEREGVVLQALFFNKEMLPDGPSEPDVESVEPSDPKFIPLEDETSGSEEFTYSYDNPGQKTTQEVQAPFQLPPDVANMLANFHQQAANAQTPMDPNNPVLANVQNLLTSISGETKDPSKAEAALEQLKSVLNNPSVMPENLGMGMSMSGMPPRLGLLGNAPPGFPIGMGGPPGAPRFPPPGPGMNGPHLGPGDHDDWGENMVGGPRPGMRGRGRPGIPMRGGRMPGPPGPDFGPMGPEFCGTDVPPPGFMGPRGGPRGRGMRGGRMRGGRPDLPVCRHYAAGGCRRGATCMFLHPGPPV